MIAALASILNNAALLQGTPTPAQFTAVTQSMFPLVIIAVMLDALIVAVWYMIGALLGNNSVKAGAKGEAIQVIGTAIIAGIVVTTLLLFGSIYWASVQGAAGNPTVLSPQTVLSLCQSLGYPLGPHTGPLLSQGTSFDFVGQIVATQFLSNPPTGKSGFYVKNPSVCDIVYETYSQSWGDGTVLVDYPLASAIVVNANLTNQVGYELSDIFVLDAYLGFLKQLSATVGLCFGVDGSCASAPFFGALPFPGAPPWVIYIQYAFQPLAGLDFITKSLTTVSSLLYLSLATFVAQLLFQNIFLFIWPWLIFGGLVLRGFYFTRKIGGLLIAIAIGAILVYPTVFGIEYLASENPQIVPVAQQPLSFCGTNQFYSYYPNFFVLPSISGIAEDCNCWPLGGLVSTEGYDVVVVNEPFFWGDSFVTNLISWFSSGKYKSLQSITSLFSINPGDFESALSNFGATYCSFGEYTGTTLANPSTVGVYNNGEGMVFGITQVYGIIGVQAYFLPFINIIITIAAIIGMSSLLGGDVTLAGLSRFV